MTLVQRIAAAVALALASVSGTAVVMPQEAERIVITAGLYVLTPEMEGTRFEAYPDTGGIWTICTGHTGGVAAGDRATPEECAAYFQGDVREVLDFLWRRLTGPVSMLCKVAIADLGYNIGTPALGRSTLLRLANAGDQRGAAEQFMRWTFVGGKDCKVAASNCSGIVKRRAIQRELCMVGL